MAINTRQLENMHLIDRLKANTFKNKSALTYQLIAANDIILKVRPFLGVRVVHQLQHASTKITNILKKHQTTPQPDAGFHI